MNKFFQLSTASVLALAFHVLPASAQTQSVEQLRTDLQNAVCLNDWDDAVRVTSSLIGSSEITPQYRQELVDFRRELQGWQASQAQFDRSSNPDCAEAIAAANQPAPVPQQAARPLDWESAAASIFSSTSSGSTSQSGSSGRYDQNLRWSGSNNEFWRIFAYTASDEAILTAAEIGEEGVIDLAHLSCTVIATDGSITPLFRYQAEVGLSADFWAALDVAAVETYCPQYNHLF